MSISEVDGGATEFDDRVVAEFTTRGFFTALVALVRIGERTATPLAPIYLNVIGAEVAWPRIQALFAGAGVQWDDASFFPVAAAEGAPLNNEAARSRLRDIEARVKAERLTVNENFFFDRHGRRMLVEEIPIR